MGILNKARNFINWLETKTSAVQPIINMMVANTGWGVFPKRTLSQYSGEAYQKNVVAYKAVRTVAQCAAGVKVQLKRDGQTVESHPALDLMNRANPWMTGRDFREAVIAHLMLTGNSYVEGVGPEGAPPRELWPLRPDRVRVKPDKTGLIGEFIYEVNGQMHKWKVDPITGKSAVCHLKLFNPLDDWYGQSPVEAAAYAIDQHNAAGSWNQALLQNAARPSGALVYKDEHGATLSDKQYSRIKEEIESLYSGHRNAGRPMILEGGMNWQSMSFSPNDMDWINGKHVSAREIALAFGVPPQMLGIPGDNTYSNYQEGRLAFYEDTVLPTLESMLAYLNIWLLSTYGMDGLEFVANVDDHPAFALKREKRWQMVSGATWMTINEKREATGYSKSPVKEADDLWLPTGLIPLEGSSAPPQEDEAAPEFGEKPEEVEDEEDEEETEDKSDPVSELFLKYSPDQPRDEAGRFEGSVDDFASSDASFSYTGSGYHDIKKADSGRLKDEKYMKHAKTINAYIRVHGTDRDGMHRGMNMTKRQLEKMLDSGEISLDSMTSFTNAQASAESFARGATGYDSGERVVLSVDVVHSAPFKSRLFTGENEFIAGKGQKFKIESVERRGKYTYIKATRK